MRRTALAFGLTLAAVAIPAGAWYVLGSADVDRTIARIEKEPESVGRQTAQILARRIGWRLEELRASESRRPYYQYQALMHDPRGVSEGIALSPSPLAEAAGDPLVELWFQIGSDGRVTSPLFGEIAPGIAPDDVSGRAGPENASDTPARLRARRSFEALRGAKAAVAQLAVTEPSTSVARTPPAGAPQVEADTPVARASRRPAAGEQESTTVQQLDPAAFYQNTVSSQLAVDLKDPQSASAQERLQAGRVKGGKSVAVVVGGFAWKQVDIAGTKALVAVRRIETPTGSFTQGFQIACDRIETSYSGATLPARMRPGPRTGPTEARLPIEGVQWRITVDPAPLWPLVGERGEVLRRRFVGGFLTATSLALLVGMLVVLQVRRAEQTAAERSRFAASAAHELRTPLASLRLYAEMLAEGMGDPARGREYARSIADEAERLGRVVSNVLGFSRLERGALTVRTSPGNLGETVRATLARLAPGLESKGAKLDATIAADLPPVAFDPDAVDQILRNLVDNAEKFGLHASDRTVAVTVESREGVVVLAVRDHGPGVDAAQRKTLFRPFARSADKDAPPGLGLGLALVQALAEAHGAEATYLAHPGGGALFQVRFPVLST